LKELSVNNFNYIYKRYKTQLYNYVLKMVGNSAFTEDIVQNVFLKFFENLEGIKNSESSNFWIFKTARNEIYKHYKNKKIRADQFNKEDSDELEIASPSNIEIEYDEQELFEFIAAELERLPVEQKEVYILKEYSQLSYKEISEIVGIDENVLRKRFFDAKNKLINRLSNIYVRKG
jgi:RNA polymerase sigma-70 factor, ECF subfamily